MSKSSDKTGTEPLPADATEVDSSPSFATAPLVGGHGLAHDTPVDASAIPPESVTESGAPEGLDERPRPIPDRSQFLMISEESTPGDSDGATTSGGRHSLRGLLDGLKWRRADPVIVRPSSEGAEAARYHGFHDLPEAGATPPPLEAVVVNATVERDGVRISPRHPTPGSESRTDVTVDVPGRGTKGRSRRLTLYGAIGAAFVLLAVVATLLLSGRSVPSGVDSVRSLTRESPAATTAAPPIRSASQAAVVVPVVAPTSPLGSEMHVREKPSSRSATPQTAPPAHPEASKPPKAEYPEL